ncbi:cortical microtubule associated protein SPIRAL1 [Scenedesmus sp. NREL 46B-D3]|nr:cortical microtubule associated protein SPIRAL1 [Scenedesmus sp. NREL 46B-D3]
MNSTDVDKMLKPILLKDLRIQCRARGLSPAGGKEQLTERLKEDMLATNDFFMRSETGEVIHANTSQAGISTGDVEGGAMRNNYTRSEGQNVGNFLTDRPSSRVMAAPGGASSIVFGTEDSNFATNNYARPDGQNVGNFLTDRKSVKVHAPPGGASQITFG